MVYDMSVHLPRQVELFLEAVNLKNEELYDQTLDSIKELINDKKFIKGLDEYEENMTTRNKEIEKNILKEIQDVVKTKNMNDVILKLNQGIKDVNDNNLNYIKTVKTYILAWIKTINEEDEEKT